MEVHLRPETGSLLQEWSAKTGRSADDLIEDALAGYLHELAQVRETLDSRYDDIKSGRVKPIDGERFFEELRQRESSLRKRHPSTLASGLTLVTNNEREFQRVGGSKVQNSAT